MTTAEKLQTIAENEQRVFDAGKQSEYDRFWDSYQQTGNVYSANYLFAQSGWNDETFKPKYSMPFISSAGNMFNSSAITDLKGILESRGLTFEFKNCTNFTNFLGYSKLTKLPVISAVKGATLNSFAYGAKDLVSVDEIILKDDGSQTFSDAFRNCESLEKIRFSGVIGQNLNFQWSTKLSKESIMNITSHLLEYYDPDLASYPHRTLTLSLEAVENAFASYEGANDGVDNFQSEAPTYMSWTYALV